MSKSTLNVAALQTIPNTLYSRKIQITDGNGNPVPSLARWIVDQIAYFKSNRAVMAIKFHAKIELDGTLHDGFALIYRDGTLIVKRKYIFLVEWDDMEGNRHEQTFEDQDEAEKEADRLRIKFDYVEIKYIPAN